MMNRMQQMLVKCAVRDKTRNRAARAPMRCNALLRRDLNMLVLGSAGGWKTSLPRDPPTE